MTPEAIAGPFTIVLHFHRGSQLVVLGTGFVRVFSIEPPPPFRLDLAVWTLRRPDNAVDRWDGETYRRALSLP